MKTNLGLVEYAKAQLGKEYWYGTYGNAASKSLHTQKKKQYPTHYLWSYNAKWEGTKVHDCVGLIKGYLWCDSADSITPKYNSAQDVSANGMLSKCVKKGTIDTMPDVAGVLVFYNGHVGVYIGNGEVVEARGHAYGVVKTKLKARNWKNWGYCPFIEYVETEVEKPNRVKEWQNAAIADGFDFPQYGLTGVWNAECEAVAKKAICKKRLTYQNRNLTRIVQEIVGVEIDGKFGTQTAKAVKEYQRAHNLEADGIVGVNTWRVMLT